MMRRRCDDDGSRRCRSTSRTTRPCSARTFAASSAARGSSSTSRTARRSEPRHATQALFWLAFETDRRTRVTAAAAGVGGAFFRRRERRRQSPSERRDIPRTERPSDARARFNLTRPPAARDDARTTTPMTTALGAHFVRRHHDWRHDRPPAARVERRGGPQTRLMARRGARAAGRARSGMRTHASAARAATRRGREADARDRAMD